MKKMIGLIIVLGLISMAENAYASNVVSAVYYRVNAFYTEVSSISNEVSQGNAWKLPKETRTSKEAGFIDKSFYFAKLMFGRRLDNTIMIGRVNSGDIDFHSWNETMIDGTNYLVDCSLGVFAPREDFTNTYVQPSISHGQVIAFSNRLDAFRSKIAAAGEYSFATNISFPTE